MWLWKNCPPPFYTLFILPSTLPWPFYLAHSYPTHSQLRENALEAFRIHPRIFTKLLLFLRNGNLKLTASSPRVWCCMWYCYVGECVFIMHWIISCSCSLFFIHWYNRHDRRQSPHADNSQCKDWEGIPHSR